MNNVSRLMLLFAALIMSSMPAVAQDDAPKQTLITNVNVFDGFADELAMNTDVFS